MAELTISDDRVCSRRCSLERERVASSHFVIRTSRQAALHLHVDVDRSFDGGTIEIARP